MNKKYEIDILTPREVAEISFLSDLKVNIMNITLDDINDIDSFKEILGEENSLKLIVSITNFKVNFLNFKVWCILNSKESHNLITNSLMIYIVTN